MAASGLLYGVFFATLFGAFAIIIGLLIYFYSYVKTCVAPGLCPTVQGYYGATPNSAYYIDGNLAILQTCGTGTDLCTTSASTLNDAVNYCNQNAKICSAFIYSGETGSVSIIDVVNGISGSSQNYDLYISQLATSLL